MISCMCFKRKAYNLYSILTIFKPPESFDLYIVLRANGSDLEFHIKLKIRRWNLPHSDLISPFYSKCLKVLNIFKNKCNNIVLGQYSTNIINNLMLNSDNHVIKIVERYFNIDYSLKVHSKNKCLKVSTSLQYTHLYDLEMLYLNIKKLTGRISWIILYITSLENLSINLSNTFLNTKE
jgi:hypothetical protein